ncbi:MAG: GlsB/YeaQ/YmgE family stress response membrane protein [Defluviimonas sp.]|nr:GlsB/YeaQ/YmgE family stress response membrane protein [Defluviimonas sp.]
MEGFIEALGWIALVLLVVVGLMAGWGASAVTGGRHLPRNLLVGVVAALAVPLLLVVAGIGALAASGLLMVLVVAAIGTVIVLVLVELLFD